MAVTHDRIDKPSGPEETIAELTRQMVMTIPPYIGHEPAWMRNPLSVALRDARHSGLISDEAYRRAIS